MNEVNFVLLVDDEPQILTTLQIVLERSGYTVRAEANAHDAFHALRTAHFDIVILDLSLPDVDGMCLLAMCRRLYPDLAMLVLTANDSVDTTMQAIRLGARGYLVKPVAPQQILLCLDEIMHERRLPRMPAKIRPHKIRRIVLDELDDRAT